MQSCPPKPKPRSSGNYCKPNPDHPGLTENINEGDVGAGNESVTRRYEFYTYTGAYDPENHEALNDIYDPANVGDYLGNQNVAANLAPRAEHVRVGGARSCGLGLRRQAEEVSPGLKPSGFQSASSSPARRSGLAGPSFLQAFCSLGRVM